LPHLKFVKISLSSN